MDYAARRLSDHWLPPAAVCSCGEVLLDVDVDRAWFDSRHWRRHRLRWLAWWPFMVIYPEEMRAPDLWAHS